jgi:WD40 repeat protein
MDSEDRAEGQTGPVEGPTEREGATVDVPPSEGTFAEGAELGGRYRIWSKLGSGGMGEVWHAFDLKLRVEVALKAMREELVRSERRLELLRSEVRAARQVVSPNVCRIYDLIEADGRELVSMEYIDGQTLLDVLKERGPLELKEAQDIASQFLAGLEAIHQAGLVHRDVKPENIMITRAGRVVLMDFGLAREEESGAGTVSGTPAYMAPEQAAGQQLDARADVYSAGVVLAEMVSPGGIKDLDSRKSLWEAVRSEPPKLPESPWAPVLKRAVARDREDRYHSAHTLTRALEEVTLRVEGAEDLNPYPGLASFTAAEAEFFFGRETEIEGFWKKLDRPQLLAIVGPSGAGKTSFIRAGVLPAAPADWASVVCTPGDAALASLARPMAREMAGDAELMERLLSFDDPDVVVEVYSRWRRKHTQVQLVVDQFEELFTLNPPDTRRRVSELLGRLVLEADVGVVLCLRDDFLMHCRELEALRPIFSELTALPRLAGSALRRALVQPATKCGYRFEDDELVGEILAEVEGERGALPLLAFAMARLWKERDQDQGLLRRRAYHAIGGVGGALARHAEDVVDRIGSDRLPIVRELFRNLVTSEGTRAVRGWDELLSVFPEGDRRSAEEVLNALIGARLLTSYEIQEEDREATRRVEIVHESLLAGWPRLVRWQTQDADAAQLRDQLRHAARTWQEHERSDDLLWTGSAYREFASWRERYPGGLSEVEEAFADALTRHAGRRRRRRRFAVAASFVALLAVLAVIGGFWRRSLDEARRAEAAGLYSLAQLRLEEHPTGALAYATASLELVDTPELRRLVVDALQRGPTEIRLATPSPFTVDFSSDGRWLATAGRFSSGGKLWPSDGGPPIVLEGSDIAQEIAISPSDDLVATTMDVERWKIGLWTFPEGRFLRALDLGDRGTTFFFRFSPDGRRLYTSTEIIAPGATGLVLEIRSWPVDGGDPDLVARLELPATAAYGGHNVDPTGTRLSWIDGRRVRIAPLHGSTAELDSAITIEHEVAVRFLGFDDTGQRLVTMDDDRMVRIWSVLNGSPDLVRTLVGGVMARVGGSVVFDSSGGKLAAAFTGVWDLDGPVECAPMRLRRNEQFLALAFDPAGRWLATGGFGDVSLWPLNGSYPRLFQGHERNVDAVFFTPDAERMVSFSQDGSVRLWHLGGGPGESSRVLYQGEGSQEPAQIRMAPDGSFVVISTLLGRVAVLPLDGGPVRELLGFTDVVDVVSVGPESRLVAAGSGGPVPAEAVVRVWDLESGELRVLDAGDGVNPWGIEFTSDGDLWILTKSILRLWDVQGREPRILEEVDLAGSPILDRILCERGGDLEDRSLTFWADDTLWSQDLDSREVRALVPHDGPVDRCWVAADGQSLVSLDGRGGIRVAPMGGGPPHLLLGYLGGGLGVSPDGRWIASGGPRSTVQLWPVPELSKPPLHTLPRSELIARLKTLTNLRVVRDDDSATGWKLEVGPFPGWETVPAGDE